MVVLQAGANTGASDELALLAVTFIAADLSLFIVFHAFRGYHRNKSRQMLFLASGLALITVIPFLMSMLVTVAGYGTTFDASVYPFVVTDAPARQPYYRALLYPLLTIDQSPTALSNTSPMELTMTTLSDILF